MGKKNRGKDSSKKLVEQNLFLNFEINQRFNLSEVHKSFVECGLNSESKIIFCDGVAGTSKAQPLYSPILTKNGWVKMGDIKEGDCVITQDGTETKVLGVYDQGIKKVYRITFSDNSSTLCCDEHLWAVKSYKQRNVRKKIKGKQIHFENPNWEIKKLKDIKNSLYARNGTHKNYTIPLVKPIEFNTKRHIISPYLLGLLLGDGGLTQKIIFTTADKEILNFIKQDLKRHPLLKGYEIKHYSNYDYCICNKKEKNNLILNEIRRLNLNCKSQYKFIPEEYFFDNIENRTYLLQGLLDTDGHLDKRTGTVYFSSSSEKLAKDVQQLVQSLGGVATIISWQPKGSETYCLSYRVRITLNNEIIPFRLKRKLKYVVPKTKYIPKRYIVAVEEEDETECRCIRVEHPSHLYVTNDFIVTHNTYLSVYCALELLKRREVEKIVYIRSLTESGKRLLGSLPGEVDDKFKPWSIPLLEKCDELINISVTNALLHQHVIKSTPINYLRGVTFNDAAVIVDEFQNLVKEEAITVLSRFGKNCKMFVVGDSMQSDIAEKSGIKSIINAFDTTESKEHGIHVFHFTENEITRSKMLKYIVKVIGNIKSEPPQNKSKK